MLPPLLKCAESLAEKKISTNNKSPDSEGGRQYGNKEHKTLFILEKQLLCGKGKGVQLSPCLMVPATGVRRDQQDRCQIARFIEENRKPSEYSCHSCLKCSVKGYPLACIMYSLDRSTGRTA